MGTTVTTNAKQGSGAFSMTNAKDNKIAHTICFKNAVDFSSFKGSNGSLHFWFFIGDKEQMQDKLVVELTSTTSRNDSNDMEYWIYKRDVQTGWNEFYLNLDDDSNDSNTGELNWSSIRSMTILINRGTLAEVETRVDDITLVTGNANTADVRFISTVESTGYQEVGYTITQSRHETPATPKSTDVYDRLYAVGINGRLDELLPSGVSGLNCSKHFHTATLNNIPNRLWDATFTVTPYWITQDGTRVEGDSKLYTFNHLLKDDKKQEANKGNSIQTNLNQDEDEDENKTQDVDNSDKADASDDTDQTDIGDSANTDKTDKADQTLNNKENSAEDNSYDFEDIWGEGQGTSGSSGNTGNSGDSSSSGSGENTDDSEESSDSNDSNKNENDGDTLNGGAEDDRNAGWGPPI